MPESIDSAPVRRFHLDNLGILSRRSAIFHQCRDLDRVDALEVGQEMEARFHSGAGDSTIALRRVE